MKDAAPDKSPDMYFRTDHLNSDLKSRSVRGGAVTLAAQGFKFSLQMISNVVLARLLTPADYGLIGMATLVIGLVSLFKDMGLSMATVQKAEINHRQVSTLFWINILASVVIMLVVAALAPIIAWFYNEPRLVGITLAIAGTFIFDGLTIQHQALLNRQMQFTTLASIDVVALASGIAAGIATAWYGGGYWSLIIVQIVTALTNTIAVWWFCRWRPGFPTKRSGIRSMLAFGRNLTGFNIINYFARNLDNVLIGRYIGAQQLGLYAKAYQLLLLPIQQINSPIASVAVPVLSRLQSNPSAYRSYYCKAVTLLAFLTTPLLLTMAALSDEFVEVLLGKQWHGASTLFKILAIAALGQPLANTNGWIFISLGQTQRMMRWGLFSGPIISLAFIIGLPWGAVGIATSYAICVHLIRYPGFFFAFKDSPIKMADLVEATWRPTVLSFLMFGVMAQTRLYFIDWNPFHRLLISCFVGLSILLLSVLVWPKARSQAWGLIETAKALKSKKSVAEQLT